MTSCNLQNIFLEVCKLAQMYHFWIGLLWPIVANLNLNHRRNFKPHLNLIFGMKIKSKFTFQIDIRNQIDFYFYLHFSFVVLVD